MKLVRFAAPVLALVLASCADAPTAAISPPEGGALHHNTVSVSVWCPVAMTVGQSNGCSATGYDSYGYVTSYNATWWSSDPNSVYVNGVGTVWADAPYGATIWADIEGVTGSAYISVNYVPVLSFVTVAPTPTTVFTGGSRQLTATARDQYGNAMGGYSFTWSSSNTAAATVSASGLVTGVAAGSASVTASTGGKSGSASVTVSNAPLATGISGSQYVARYQSAQYTASTSGGTAPYTYQWRTRQGNAYSWGAWQSWYGTGSTSYTYASLSSCGVDRNQIEVKATDALGATATSSYTVYITNPC